MRCRPFVGEAVKVCLAGRGFLLAQERFELMKTLAQGPVLIEAVVDQFTPPMPAKIKAAQALKLAQALARGEPNRIKIALTNAHDTVRELV